MKNVSHILFFPAKIQSYSDVFAFLLRFQSGYTPEPRETEKNQLRPVTIVWSLKCVAVDGIRVVLQTAVIRAKMERWRAIWWDLLYRFVNMQKRRGGGMVLMVYGTAKNGELLLIVQGMWAFNSATTIFLLLKIRKGYKTIDRYTGQNI